jgi:deoxyadenosine/deoxycytidine kinase
MIAEGLHSAVQDRSIYEDAHIFARNLYEQGQMEKREYHNYLDLYQCMSQALQPPDVIVYLKKSLPHLKKGILKRNREYEKNLPDQYLLDLNRYYEDWFEHYSLGKKLVIESDSLDFVNQSEDFDVVCEKILGTLDQGDFLLQSTLKA